jgi:diacylglycerol kinase (ATP)
LPAASWSGRSWVEVAFRVAAAIGILIVEVLNTALKQAAERVSLNLHPLAKRAKDMASAAVLLAVMRCAGVWCAALWMHWQP